MVKIRVLLQFLGYFCSYFLQNFWGEANKFAVIALKSMNRLKSDLNIEFKHQKKSIARYPFFGQRFGDLNLNDKLQNFWTYFTIAITCTSSLGSPEQRIVPRPDLNPPNTRKEELTGESLRSRRPVKPTLSPFSRTPAHGVTISKFRFF